MLKEKVTEKNVPWCNSINGQIKDFTGSYKFVKSSNSIHNSFT